MVAVLIHASGIHLPQGRANWALTIERLVDFRTGRVADALADWERIELEELHPSGRAQFWGTHGYYTRRIAPLAAGDVVAFPGNSRVLAFGRIGLLTDNASLGDALWLRNPKHGSYRHVYSLAPLQFVEMPQVDFRRRGGFGAADDFRGLRVLSGARADDFLAAFSAEIPDPAPRVEMSPVERELQEVQAYRATDEALARELRSVRELHLEVRSMGDAPVRARAASSMHRGENLLVHDYASHLPPDAEVGRRMTTVGMTDLDVRQGARHELVEAKSSASRPHVRQALAQLLDYAAAMTDEPPHVLTALFPRRPDDSAVGLLSRYGIDCVYRLVDGSYERVAAPPERAEAVGALWKVQKG